MDTSKKKVQSKSDIESEYEAEECKIVREEIKKLIDIIDDPGSLEDVSGKFACQLTQGAERIQKDLYDNKVIKVRSWTPKVTQNNKQMFFMKWLVNAPVDDDNRTLLHYIAEHKTLSLEKAKWLGSLLLQLGASLDARTKCHKVVKDTVDHKYGDQTPLDVCVQAEFKEFLKTSDADFRELWDKRKIEFRQKIEAVRKIQKQEVDKKYAADQLAEKEKEKNQVKYEPVITNTDDLKDSIELEEKFDDEILRAIQTQDYSVVISRISQNNIHALDKNGYNLLYHTVMSNQLDQESKLRMVDLLCLLGADMQQEVGTDEDQTSLVEHIVMKTVDEATTIEAVNKNQEPYRAIIRILDPHNVKWHDAMVRHTDKKRIPYQGSHEGLLGYVLNWLNTQNLDTWLTEKQSSPFIRYILEASDNNKYRIIGGQFIEKYQTLTSYGHYIRSELLNTIGQTKSGKNLTLWDLAQEDGVLKQKKLTSAEKAEWNMQSYQEMQTIRDNTKNNKIDLNNSVFPDEYQWHNIQKSPNNSVKLNDNLSGIPTNNVSKVAKSQTMTSYISTMDKNNSINIESENKELGEDWIIVDQQSTVTNNRLVTDIVIGNKKSNKCKNLLGRSGFIEEDDLKNLNPDTDQHPKNTPVIAYNYNS